MRFEWDPVKNEANIRKHRVSFEVARLVFDDPDLIEFDVTEDDYGEERFQVTGRPVLDRTLVLIVIVTYRHPDIVRLISARKAEPEDERAYLARFGPRDG